MTLDLTKPARGSGWLARKERTAERKNHERREMDAAKARDDHRCRFPRCPFMTKKPRIESAHLFHHRGMGGDPSGQLTERKLCAALCFIHHSMLDRAEIGVEPLDRELMADGLLAWYQRTESGSMECVAVEQRRAVSVTRSAS